MIGQRGTGKTYFLEEQVLPANHLPKVLIVDTIDHPRWRHVPEISLQGKFSVKNCQSGTYRIFRENPDDVLEVLANDLNNTLLICEDASKYLKAKLQPAARSLMVDSKQRNNDVFFLFHDWSYCPKDIWRLLDWVTIFKTNLSPITRKNDIPAYKLVETAWQQVMNDSNKYANVTLHIGP